METEHRQGGQTLDLELATLGRKYEPYRFVAPRTEERLARSLRVSGQLSPITVVEEAGVYEVLDGFKRVRAAEQIAGLTHLEAKQMAGGPGKTVMLRLNLDRKGLDPVEEGLLMQAMHRTDGIPQNEIGRLVGRHRSWVCRRIALAERLDEDVVENLRLGLLTPSQGRALALLPRGNQGDVLAEILDAGLTSRETAALVKALSRAGIYDVPQIRAEIAAIRAAEENGQKERGVSGESIARLLRAMAERCEAVTDYLEDHPEWRPGQRNRVRRARDTAALTVARLDTRLGEACRD